MHILILGAGYAGLRAAINLDRQLVDRTDLLHITLVERNPYHQHIIQIHLTATDAANPAEVAIPLDTLLQGRNVRRHQGEVSRIDPLNRQVLLQDGLALSYDRLVLALGAQTNYAGVPGAREYTWPLRSYAEALRLRQHISDCFQQAAQTDDPAVRRKLLTFVIVGGGFTGCQLAGELVDYAGKLCNTWGLPRSDVSIALLERSGMLLKQFGAWADKEARRALTQCGVSLHDNTTVQRVKEQAVYVAPGRLIRTATIIWTAGVRAPALLAESGLTTDAIGRLVVDRYLRGVGPDQSRIFAAGDCASIPDPSVGTIPMTASYAMRQGEHLAETLLAEATGTPPRMYQPQRLGLIVSLGPGAAIGNPLGIVTRGLPTALLKQAIEKWYLTTLWA